MMTQQSGQNWTQRQFQGAWLGLAIAEAMTKRQIVPDPSALQPVESWTVPTPNSALSQTLASDCTAHLPLTAQAAQLSQHLIDSLHPRQPGLSWLDIQNKYLQSAEPETATLINQAVTLLPLWLLISDRPDAIAYITQHIQMTAPNPNAALSFIITVLTLRHSLTHPLAPSSCGYTPMGANRLLHQLRTDLESNLNGLQTSQAEPSRQQYEQLYAAVAQAPTLIVARSLIHSLPVELRPIATALYSLTHLGHDFTQALRCAHSIQPQSQTAIALTGIALGLANPLSLPPDWRTVVKTLPFPPTSTSLTTISQTLWQAWAGAYIPQHAS